MTDFPCSLYLPTFCFAAVDHDNGDLAVFETAACMVLPHSNFVNVGC